ncbi:hypothetical protein A9P82_13040 [Arachidicoccus ginsenosidimutans]|uniref:hypothetical protein n=1 Tax=Arachidicoccus sp. BS20 TaxID=1850526 RepID=UPI0007F11930|nr:hypothetical protein [Arachidicoccus sp. BS20]ANI90128.1 hypothetical protein A9P82_13040 [Arachidicoccus sp. BS20]
MLPKYFGGFGTDISYKNFTLNAFFTFKNQDNGNLSFYYNYPGSMYNQPSIVLDRWQNPGDNTTFPKYTTTDDESSWYYLYNSTRSYFHNSYIRLAALSLSYNVPAKWLKKSPFHTLQVYALGNNLFTSTSFAGMDPDVPYGTPPLRSFTFGIRTNF